MTRRDKWAKRPVVMRCWAFREAVRQSGIKITDNSFITFGMPMPPSWSKKKKAEFDGNPHRNKPDADNIIKNVFDALFQEDSHISQIHCRKIWAYEGFIEVCEKTIPAMQK